MNYNHNTRQTDDTHGHTYSPQQPQNYVKLETLTRREGVFKGVQLQEKEEPKLL